MAKLLLAEDDEFSRDMLTRRLQRNGYEVTAVADGREALAVALQLRPDLILMDLDMPVMDGRNAMRLLKTDVRTFRIPIIILSAHTKLEDVGAAVAAGCHSFEAKPIVLRRLIDRIEEAIQANNRKKAVWSGETGPDE
jgi:CheY-like chemotaxis protein